MNVTTLTVVTEPSEDGGLDITMYHDGVQVWSNVVDIVPLAIDLTIPEPNVQPTLEQIFHMVDSAIQEQKRRPQTTIGEAYEQLFTELAMRGLVDQSKYVVSEGKVFASQTTMAEVVQDWICRNHDNPTAVLDNAEAIMLVVGILRNMRP